MADHLTDQPSREGGRIWTMEMEHDWREWKRLATEHWTALQAAEAERDEYKAVHDSIRLLPAGVPNDQTEFVFIDAPGFDDGTDAQPRQLAFVNARKHEEVVNRHVARAEAAEAREDALREERRAAIAAINLYGDETLHKALDDIGWPHEQFEGTNA